ncbi:MAG: hypothetical protein N3I86_12805 [Verrucomicrobiae bacterium]|nr:hypothetical protein [Verrucomicrobiae bacterium]
MSMRLWMPAFAGAFLFTCNLTRAVTIAENFSADPLASGWSLHGNSQLFNWDATGRRLDVTWDSSQPNSYFCRPFGPVLTRTNDFLLSFDILLHDIGPGVDTNKTFTFQIAVGLMNLAQATNSGFIRGSGFQSPNLVEWNYFWDSGFGATISPVLISSNSQFSSGGFTFPLELATNTVYSVTMRYLAEEGRLVTVMKSNGVPIGPINDATLGPNFSDFAVDHLSVSSYNDAGQFPGFEGSVLAHGWVDNFVFAAPPPVTRVAAGNAPGSVQFRSTTNWLYHLERTTNFLTWTAVSALVPGTGGDMTLQDTNPPPGRAFYRVQARLP